MELTPMLIACAVLIGLTLGIASFILSIIGNAIWQRLWAAYQVSRQRWSRRHIPPAPIVTPMPADRVYLLDNRGDA